MNLKKLEAQLVGDEGRRLCAYQDTKGLWTIGIGHHDSEVHEGLVWTDEKVDEVFADDVGEKIAQCEGAFPWFASLNEARQACLIEMCFQMGLSGLLGFKKALAAIRDERFHEAAGQMRDSDWAKQTPKRARRTAYQMETGEWQV